MKSNTKYIYKMLFALILGISVTACNDFLDREPLSNVPTEMYLTEESQLEAYANKLYTDILPGHGAWGYGLFEVDNHTDNQTSITINDRYTKDRWRVPHSEGSNWNFGNIYRCNFFFSEVLPKYGEDSEGSKNTISGDLNSIKHYIGEMYFLRAYEYYKKYIVFGDFPIVTVPLKDNLDELSEASKRSPRNEVARFILSDLDNAVTLLSDKNMATTRINKNVAILLKSRVALIEGTWLKNFKGTAFVPQGEGWPGKQKESSANYQYPSGGIDNEIDFFLDAAIDASKQVAEIYKSSLTENTGVLQQAANEPNNPYYDMFAQEDLSTVQEVLLWRQYGFSISTHNVNVAACSGNQRIGITRGLVNSFLMEDGTPVYANGEYVDGNGYYMGDKTIADVRVNRDSRLSVFLKEPGQQNVLYELDNEIGNNAVIEEPKPLIVLGDVLRGYSTGYALRKGGSFNRKHYGSNNGYTGAIIFRASEALLNYMEASYEKNGLLDATAREYWILLRARANVSTDIDKTIAVTDMAKEAENDWAAYSAGKLVDETLYNIRRERRCEFMSEGFRYIDLRRWRSLDQMIDNPYHVEGFHLWNTPMEDWYEGELIADGTNNANVSSKENSEYLRPHQRYAGQSGFNGSTWLMAHYLSPIMVKEFQITATSGSDVETSTIYQNPYWPIVADKTAEK